MDVIVNNFDVVKLVWGHFDLKIILPDFSEVHTEDFDSNIIYYKIINASLDLDSQRE